MKLAVTADLHWGLDRRGDAAVVRLRSLLDDVRPDLFAILGDVGEGAGFARCLRLFRDLPCPRLVVAGNHDIWTRIPSPHSMELLDRVLPEAAAESGFQWLEDQCWLARDGRLAVAGSMNWYDYSFADPELIRRYPLVDEMYRDKLFPDAIHMDGVRVRLGVSDGEFASRLTSGLGTRLAGLPTSVERVVLVTHHPGLRELFWPDAPSTDAQRFWLAYSGNRAMDGLLRADPRIRWVLCGHTHRSVHTDVGSIRAINIGGDYDWKRLVVIDTDSGLDEAFEFRPP